MTPPIARQNRAYFRLAAVILELDVESLVRRLEAERTSMRAEADPANERTAAPATVTEAAA